VTPKIRGYPEEPKTDGQRQNHNVVAQTVEARYPGDSTVLARGLDAGRD
jgi:hypothetical protein